MKTIPIPKIPQAMTNLIGEFFFFVLLSAFNCTNSICVESSLNFFFGKLTSLRQKGERNFTAKCCYDERRHTDENILI